MQNSLYNNWEKLTSGKILPGEKRELLALTYKISLACLKIKYVNNELLKLQETNPENLAIDTTAFLFSNNRSNRLRIIESLNGHAERILTESELKYYFQRAVTKATEKTVRFEMVKSGRLKGDKR